MQWHKLQKISLKELYQFLHEIAKSNLKPAYGPERTGDVKHNMADISKAKELLGYKPDFTVREGLRKVYW